MNASAALVLRACALHESVSLLLEQCAFRTGEAQEQIAADVETIVNEFTQRGLIGRPDGPSIFLPQSASQEPFEGNCETIQKAGNHVIRFRCSDVMLCTEVASVLGLTTTTAHPTTTFFIEKASDGSVIVHTDSDWHFHDVAEMRTKLVTIVNDFVARTATDLVLHAGSLIAPSGEVGVFPAPPGNGKSTLCGALTQRGWTYLGDESTTIRHEDRAVVPYAKPLTLSASGCRALGVVPGKPTRGEDEDVALDRLGTNVMVQYDPTVPLGHVVLPHYVGNDGESNVEQLHGDEAIVALIANSLNLRYAGNRALETLVELAERVPVHRIAYRSTDEAIAQLQEIGLE